MCSPGCVCLRMEPLSSHPLSPPAGLEMLDKDIFCSPASSSPSGVTGGD